MQQNAEELQQQQIPAVITYRPLIQQFSEDYFKGFVHGRLMPH